MANAITWVEILVADFDRAKRFYDFVFHTDIEYVVGSEPRYGTFPYEMGAGGGCSIVEMKDHRPAREPHFIYLNGGDNLSEPLSRVEKAGGLVVVPKTANGNFGFVAQFLDTEGNCLLLHSWE
jgi:predicted enzyme related to lactoylglutathione lyase